MDRVPIHPLLKGYTMYVTQWIQMNEQSRTLEYHRYTTKTHTARHKRLHGNKQAQAIRTEKQVNMGGDIFTMIYCEIVRDTGDWAAANKSLREQRREQRRNQKQPTKA